MQSCSGRCSREYRLRAPQEEIEMRRPGYRARSRFLQQAGGASKMTKPLFAAMLAASFALFFPPVAGAQDASPSQIGQVSQIGDSKQFDQIRVTLESVAIDGEKADVALRMDNLSEEEKQIAFLLFVEAQAETGEYGDYDYYKTRCDGTIPPKGQFACQLALIFPAAPKAISLRVGEGMAGEVVTFTLAR